ncbi:MAG: hypothetical protein Q4C74_02555 [Rothia sp. (in: high G+C Gram-positive bacteria)]|nr:hypothetical protein [Rothia sp. (in: high G+C Gram-positive bacteria)]
MKKSKFLLSIVLLGAGVSLVLQQHLIVLALVALAVFIVASDGSFEEVPPRKKEGQPYPSAQEIRRYREENPGVSIARAVEALRGAARWGGEP